MLKNTIKNCLNKLGYTISKRNNYNNLLLQKKINLLIDVGAHKGEYALKARKSGYKNQIISFEPQIKAFNVLKERSKKDKLWIIHPRCALGNRNGHTKINIINETQCSSILNPNKNLYKIDKNFKLQGNEDCNIFTIDFLFKKFYRIKKRTYLKIDTQGYERFVLMGCKTFLKKIDFIELELSINPLYNGEYDYIYFIKLMKRHNFNLLDLEPFARDYNGKLLQFNAIFSKVI